jgi:glycosyltransferase involved in cell wall biosynthesis
MTRALHVVSGNLYGGVETFVVTLARYRNTCLALDQQFAVCFDGRLKRELSAAGASVYELGAVRVRQPLSIWKARRRLLDLIDENRIDMVICHMAWAHSIFGPAARAAGKSLVFWLHMATEGRHWLERWAKMTQPDLVMAPSRFVADTAASMFPHLDAKVVHYAVAPPDDSLRSERLKVREEFDTAIDAIVTVQACRLEEWKGQRIHLQALARLREVVGWNCWIVGGAQRPHEVRLLESLKSEAISLGISDRVRFVGQRSDVPRILAAADIYCQPNTGLEGLPVVFTEALDARLPIVTSDIGGFWEIVDETCGIRVPVGDSSAVAEALRRLIVGHDERMRLGDLGRVRARAMCDPVRQIQKIQRLLDGLEHGGERDRAEASGNL